MRRQLPRHDTEVRDYQQPQDGDCFVCPGKERGLAISYSYYDVVDWIADGVILVLVVAGFLLVLREWRRTNRLAAEQVTVAERQVNASAQQANSIDRLAAAITNHTHATAREDAATDAAGQ